MLGLVVLRMAVARGELDRGTSSPWPPSGTVCNQTAWDKICPSQPRDVGACMQCCEAHKDELFRMGCVGTDVWPDHCEGKPLPPLPPGPPPPPPPGPIVLDREDPGPRFDGLGAISGGGATTRLLVDYVRSEREFPAAILIHPTRTRTHAHTLPLCAARC